MSFNRFDHLDDSLLIHALSLSSPSTGKRNQINQFNRDAIKLIGEDTGKTAKNLQFKPSFEHADVDRQDPLPLVTTDYYTANLKNIRLATNTLHEEILKQCHTNNIEIPADFSLETAPCTSVAVAVPGYYTADDQTDCEGVAKAEFAPVYHSTSYQEERVYVLCYPLNGATGVRLDRLKVQAMEAMSCLNIHGDSNRKTALATTDIPNAIAMDLSVTEAERFKKIAMNGYVIAFINYELIPTQAIYNPPGIDLTDFTRFQNSGLSDDELLQLLQNDSINRFEVSDTYTGLTAYHPSYDAIRGLPPAAPVSRRSAVRSANINTQNAYNVSVAGAAAINNTVEINEPGRRILKSVRIFLARSLIINVKQPLVKQEALARIELMKASAQQLEQHYNSFKHITFNDVRVAATKQAPSTEMYDFKLLFAHCMLEVGSATTLFKNIQLGSESSFTRPGHFFIDFDGNFDFAPQLAANLKKAYSADFCDYDTEVKPAHRIHFSLAAVMKNLDDIVFVYITRIFGNARYQQAHYKQTYTKESNFHKLLDAIKPITDKINPEKASIIQIVLLRMLGIKENPLTMTMTSGGNFISEKMDVHFYFRIEESVAQKLVIDFLAKFAPDTNKARIVPAYESNNKDRNIQEIAIEGEVLLSRAFLLSFKETLKMVLENEPRLMQDLRKSSNFSIRSVDQCIRELEHVVFSFANVTHAVMMTEAILSWIAELKNPQSTLTQWKSHGWPVRSATLFFQSKLPDNKANDEFLQGAGKVIEDNLTGLQIVPVRKF